MAIRCDHCRGSLGLVAQQYWRMQFCLANCVEAYQSRLDDETKAKIRCLGDMVGLTIARRFQDDRTINRIEVRAAKLSAPLRYWA